MTVWLIGIDDTDVPGSRGTGRLARMLAAALAEQRLQPCGITRHQLLVHPDVPYTTHDSSACVAVEWAGADISGLFEWMCRYVEDRSPAGSDPGICVAPASAVHERAVRFGRRAQQTVVMLSEAERVATKEGFLHAGLGGNREGMIGSLAAVGLRASGEDGRFIELGDIRRVRGRAQVQCILNAGVTEVRCVQAENPKPQDWVQTLDWVRPRLLGGRAVLLVERSAQHGTDWVVADRRAGSSRRRGKAASVEV